jgi:hypothetical protein
LIEYGIGVFFLNLKKMGIVEDLLLWFKDYLSNRKQRVIINGKEWNNLRFSLLVIEINQPSVWAVLNLLQVWS